MTLGEFFDAWEILGDAVLAGTIAGVVLGCLGVYVVLRRMVFLTAALSQTAGLGVAMAFWVSLALVDHRHAPGELLFSPTLGALAATTLAVIVLMPGRPRGEANGDRLLGLLFLGASSGTVLVGTQIVQEVQDIETLLFGTAVAVLPEHLRLLAATGGALLLIQLLFWRGFVSVTLDPQGARIRRMPTFVLELVLMGGLALAVAVATRVLGALPAFAFSVLPAMAAVRLAPNVPRALWIGGALGGACGFWGYVAATLWDLPVGAAQTALGVVVAVCGVAAGAVIERFAGRTRVGVAGRA